MSNLFKSSPMFDSIEFVGHQHDLGCIPGCHEIARNLPALPATYGEGLIEYDSDEYGGPSLGCLNCRETQQSDYSTTSIYLVYQLSCRECGEPFVRIDTLYGGIHLRSLEETLELSIESVQEKRRCEDVGAGRSE